MMTPNDADLGFEQATYAALSELDNIRGIIRQVSASYRSAQLTELEKVRAEVDKLIQDWKARADTR